MLIRLYVICARSVRFLVLGLLTAVCLATAARAQQQSFTWEEIREGTALPRLEKRPGVTQLVKYAAGSGDFNPLHHDYGFPQAKQIGSIIVHGRFKYAALGELVSNWLGHRGRIRKISCQFRGMDFPDQPIVCTGILPVSGA